MRNPDNGAPQGKTDGPSGRRLHCDHIQDGWRRDLRGPSLMYCGVFRMGILQADGRRRGRQRLDGEKIGMAGLCSPRSSSKTHAGPATSVTADVIIPPCEAGGGAKRSLKDTFRSKRHPALRISNFKCDSLERRRCKTFARKIPLGLCDKPLRKRRGRGSKSARVTDTIWAADHLAVAQAVRTTFVTRSFRGMRRPRSE